MNKRCMKPIEEFPYSDKSRAEDTLLLKMKSSLNKYAVGHYNATLDLFRICGSPFRSTTLHRYDDRPIKGRDFADYYCVMPEQFLIGIGPKRIEQFMFMDDALSIIFENDLWETDIGKTLDKSLYCKPYLVCMKDRRIIITETRSFTDNGTQFCAATPTNINDSIYHTQGIIPREEIYFATDLEAFHKKVEQPGRKKRMVDVDELFGEIRKNDLSYMQQNDIMDCIKDVIER